MWDNTRAVLAEHEKEGRLCLGDVRALECINFAEDSVRRRIFKSNHGADFNLPRITFYANRMLQDVYIFWFRGDYTKTHVRRVMSFLTKLKKDVTPQQEMQYLIEYYALGPQYTMFMDTWSTNGLLRDKELMAYFESHGVQIH